ncbi:hypothetical protein [Thermospira aquatica]|uniref:Uncharacterized protein n=1 Tax=Thermospira aquatica TaxID=2828656 RepID=A0AAX3BD96_9SPIR|nr:hypothetical protein [Thermospira aquatica]URA10250.1 hypothetical protein KDW03_00125 [Thermospira aquatica]
MIKRPKELEYSYEHGLPAAIRYVWGSGKGGGRFFEGASKWSAIAGGVSFAGGVVCTVIPGAQPAAPFFFATAGYLFTASTVTTEVSAGSYLGAVGLESKDGKALGGAIKNFVMFGIDIGLSWATKGVSKLVFKPAIQNVDDLVAIAYKNGKPYVKAGYKGVADWFGTKPGRFISSEQLHFYFEYQRELSQMTTEMAQREFLRGMEAFQNTVLVGVEKLWEYNQNSNYPNIQVPSFDTNIMYNGKKNYDYLKYGR